MIDVSEMKKIRLSGDHKTVTVQPGLKGSEVQKELYEYGLLVPTGLCLTPRVGGYTLGGGHSAVVRQYGLTIYQLLEIEMVDANGNIVTANKKENSDLFWALRGDGGGNFEVCSLYKFRTHPIDQVAYVSIGWDLADFPIVLEKWQEYNISKSDYRFTPLLTALNPLVSISDEDLEKFQEQFPGKSLPSLYSVTV